MVMKFPLDSFHSGSLLYGVVTLHGLGKTVKLSKAVADPKEVLYELYASRIKLQENDLDRPNP
jgi:hypothetical protein